VGATKLKGELQDAVYPLRVAALLDLRATGSWTSRLQQSADNLRTQSDTNWQEIVTRLIDTAPLIIVDSRVFSSHLLQETVVLLQRPDAVRRAIFLISKKRERCLFEKLPENRVKDLRVMDVEELPEYCRRLTGYGTYFGFG